MKPHLRYLRYVLMHKFYVFFAGIAIGRISDYSRWWWVRHLWRLTIHDWSKFRPSEWHPYVAHFYGPQPPNVPGAPRPKAQGVQTANFNLAWLRHQQRNDHHWQNWVLKQDDGRVIVLLMPDWTADEMLADWMGAGSKIMRWPTMAECVAETVAWYAKNANVINIRQPVRVRVEETLLALSHQYGLTAMAFEVEQARAARASIVIPGRV